MSLRHLSSSQNKELASVILGMAKAIGIAAMVSFFFTPTGEAWAVEYWVGAIAVGTLLTVLGLRIHGRAVDEEKRDSRSVSGSKSRRKR